MENKSSIINEFLELARELETNREYVRFLRAHLLIQELRAQIDSIQYLLWRSHYYVNGKDGEKVLDQQKSDGYRAYHTILDTLDTFKHILLDGEILKEIPRIEAKNAEGVFLENRKRYRY